MSLQRGAYQVPECLFIEEGTFGTTPVTGAWATPGFVHSINAKRASTHIRKTGIGTQLPAGFVVAKEHWTAALEYSLVKKDTSPAYNWKDFYAMITNPNTGVPKDTCKYFSLGYKLDLTADEFGWLKGCGIKSFKIAGSDVADTVKATVDIIAQNGSYDTADYVSGSATRTGAPDTELVVFGDCDILYDTATPASIFSRLNSFAITFTRDLQMRGSDASNGKLYREFAPRARSYEIELGIDFDSKVEYKQFLADTAWLLTAKIPTGTGGLQLAFTGGKWLNAEKPIREVDLINLTMRGECTGLTISDIA